MWFWILIALLTVHELGLAEYLRSRFSRVTVPQHVIDEIQQLAYTMRWSGNPYGYLGKGDDGRYALAEVPETHWMIWREFLQSILQLAESFERVPSYRMLDVGDIDGPIAAFTETGVGAAYASDEDQSARLLLVSDDLVLSVFARSTGMDAVNTQAILVELRRSNVITDELYSSFIERLASLNYTPVLVRPEEIIRSLEANGYATTDGTRAMLRMLEGPGCPEDSAVMVGAEVVTALAKIAPPGQVELVLVAVLVALRRGREVGLVLHKFRRAIESKLKLAPLRRDHILQTMNHYFPV